MEQQKRSIVLAADVDSLTELGMLASLTRELPASAFSAVKVGCMLGLRYGLPYIVEAVKNANPDVAVIYDHQKAGTDIPAMGRNFMKVCSDAGVDEVIVFPQAGPATLAGFVEPCLEYGMKPIVGLTMTHPKYLHAEGGWIDDNAPNRILTLACDLKVTNFVLPGNKLDLLQKYAIELHNLVGEGTVLMPGIGTQGGSVLSACVGASPHEAKPIIGSAIYRDPSPQAAMERFCAWVRETGCPDCGHEKHVMEPCSNLKCGCGGLVDGAA